MKRKIKNILIIIIGILVCASTQSQAGLSVKPAPAANKNHVLVNTSIGNSYELCQQMTNAGESLYGTTVKPHLATNKDWGAVSYLSHSIYGTNATGENTGTQITINGVNYYSTNGNATGVMNWGNNPYVSDMRSQTSGILQGYIDLTDKTTVSTVDYNDVRALVENNETNFVEALSGTYNNASTKGMAMSETINLHTGWKNGDNSVTAPVSIRNGLFGYSIAGRVLSCDCKGYSNVTFRPVIWN